jgi:hypothetical protein
MTTKLSISNSPKRWFRRPRLRTGAHVVVAHRQKLKLFNLSSAEADKNRKDLEASIRLARMDLSDLQGLPLPSQ